MNFLQMPKIIFNPKSRYFKLSNNAKIMYALMIDRYSLSISNYKKGDKTFFDEHYNRCFIVFSTGELIKYTGLSSRTTVIKTKQELIDLGLIKAFGSSKGSKFFVYQPKDDIQKDKNNYKKEKVNINILEENKKISIESELNAKDIILGNFVKEDNSNSSLIVETNDDYLIKKWKIKEDCDICQRLLQFFINKNIDGVSDHEFWYLRNTIQRYEVNNNIVNFGAFVKSLRRQYNEQKNFLKVNVGEKTTEDIHNELSRVYSNEQCTEDKSIRDILNYNYLKDTNI